MEIDRYPDLERRKSPRFKDNIFIFGRLRSNPTEDFKAFTKDISAGGLSFETERNMAKEGELEIEICQPINCSKAKVFSMPVLAKIIWIQKIEKDNFGQGENKYRMGIEFSRIQEADRQRITKYVEEKVAKK